MILIIPKRFQNLTSKKKILFKNYYLKVDFLFHFIHHFIFNYAFDKDELRLNARVLQKFYGKDYLRYIEYLVEQKVIMKTGNYSSHLNKSTKYRFIEKVDEVIIHNSTDFILNRKYKEIKSEKVKIVKDILSTIPMEIRSKLITDLLSITIDKAESMRFIDETIKNNKRKYIKNLIMILKISEGDLFFKFDKFGRFHSNFTNLRKGIRNRFLLIDGEPISSIDIRSSQPFFLAQLLKREWLINQEEEVQRFIKLVEQDDIYNYFLKKHPSQFRDRNAVKPMLFKCLFDNRRLTHRYKDLFRNEFPVVMDFIEQYFLNYGEYLWKTLQRMESHFIFNTVYPIIINQSKDIKLFTVHDSIHFPARYHQEIEKIWNQEMQRMINNEKKKKRQNYVL